MTDEARNYRVACGQDDGEGFDYKCPGCRDATERALLAEIERLKRGVLVNAITAHMLVGDPERLHCEVCDNSGLDCPGLADEASDLRTRLSQAEAERDEALAHLGDPCVFCGTAHDDVEVGPCPGRNGNALRTELTRLRRIETAARDARRFLRVVLDVPAEKWAVKPGQVRRSGDPCMSREDIIESAHSALRKALDKEGE